MVSLYDFLGTNPYAPDEYEGSKELATFKPIDPWQRGNTGLQTALGNPIIYQPSRAYVPPLAYHTEPTNVDPYTEFPSGEPPVEQPSIEQPTPTQQTGTQSPMTGQETGGGLSLGGITQGLAGSLAETIPLIINLADNGNLTSQQAQDLFSSLGSIPGLFADPQYQGVWQSLGRVIGGEVGNLLQGGSLGGSLTPSDLTSIFGALGGSFGGPIGASAGGVLGNVAGTGLTSALQGTNFIDALTSFSNISSILGAAVTPLIGMATKDAPGFSTALGFPIGQALIPALATGAIPTVGSAAASLGASIGGSLGTLPLGAIGNVIGLVLAAVLGEKEQKKRNDALRNQTQIITQTAKQMTGYTPGTYEMDPNTPLGQQYMLVRDLGIARLEKFAQMGVNPLDVGVDPYSGLTADEQQMLFGAVNPHYGDTREDLYSQWDPEGNLASAWEYATTVPGTYEGSHGTKGYDTPYSPIGFGNYWGQLWDRSEGVGFVPQRTGQLEDALSYLFTNTAALFNPKVQAQIQLQNIEDQLKATQQQSLASIQGLGGVSPSSWDPDAYGGFAMLPQQFYYDPEKGYNQYFTTSPDTAWNPGAGIAAEEAWPEFQKLMSNFAYGGKTGEEAIREYFKLYDPSAAYSAPLSQILQSGQREEALRQQLEAYKQNPGYQAYLATNDPIQAQLQAILNEANQSYGNYGAFLTGTPKPMFGESPLAPWERNYVAPIYENIVYT